MPRTSTCQVPINSNTGLDVPKVDFASQPLREGAVSCFWSRNYGLWCTEMRIPDHLTCFLRNLYAGQEVTVRTGHGPTDWFQTGRGVHQGCILLSPCLFNFYAEYIMRNAGLEEAQTGVKIARRNINNLRYADNITLMAESQEELEMKAKEESEKVGLKLSIQKTKIMASGPITNRWGNNGNSSRLHFLGLQNHCRW